MDLNSLFLRRENLKKGIERYRKFVDWVQENPQLTKKAIVEEATRVFPGDWRNYALKTARKGEIHDKVRNICERSIHENEEAIQSIEQKIEQLLNENVKNLIVSVTSERLHNVLDHFLESNPNFFSQRELDCLVYLIDNGVISTEDELAEYGVKTVL